MSRATALGLATVAILAVALFGFTPDPAPVAAAEGAPTFTGSIQPIVQERCNGCHVKKSRGKLSMKTLESTMEGGKSGKVVIPGDAENSRLYRLVAGLDDKKKMPPKGDRLKPEQIATIKQWIDSGAK